ncbi:MAG: hypothetical protein ACYDFT_06870, partial [Thermoplasmata archaeon]
IFAGLTLGLLEGQPEGGAVDRFLSAAARLGTRRGLTVAVLPTTGAPAKDGAAAGGTIRTGPGGETIRRPFFMRAGLSDTGAVGVVLVPWAPAAPAAARPVSGRRDRRSTARNAS